VLFIPILNVDGHERFSAFTRINQRGPVEAGWRTTARNLNLNRDFTKLDAPETRALVTVLNRWEPDLHVDLHVTDGSDHQYDVTFGHNSGSGWSPASEAWLERVYILGTRRSSLATERRRERFAAGSVRVPTDQPLGDLAMVLLEPASPDSFFRWGFFLEILQPTEYVEGYIMEPTAARMLASDSAVRAEFERHIEEDHALASKADERLQWLYQRTPYFDERWRLYPVGRETR
jgi:hypothetical protein